MPAAVQPRQTNTPFRGFAYAVLDDAGTLTFFRSEETYDNDTTGTFTDLAGASLTGTIFAGLERNGLELLESPPWREAQASVTAIASDHHQPIRPGSMTGWFCNMERLEVADLSGLDTSAVTSLALLFCGCRSLTSIDFSGWDTSTFTSLRDLFNGCTSLCHTGPLRLGHRSRHRHAGPLRRLLVARLA